MPTPHPHGDTDANRPVNVAVPNWQCPHCRTKYGTDLESATACAEAGPVPDVVEGAPVLVLPQSAESAVVFGTTKVGPVRSVKTATGRAHERDVVVAGQRVAPAELADAPTADDGLRLVLSRRAQPRRHTNTSPSLGSYGRLAKLMVGDTSYGRYADAKVNVWIDEPSWRNNDRWYLPPNEEQRAALNVVTADLLDRVADADVEKLLLSVRARYAPGRNGYRPETAPVDLAKPTAGLMIAEAHGSTNHVWSLRWLNAHIEQVTAWQVDTLRAWARGEGGPLPLPSPPHVNDNLPRNPGKRRLAAMEPFGTDYHRVRDAVLDQLATEAPVNPISTLPTVEETLTSKKKESADHV